MKLGYMMLLVAVGTMLVIAPAALAGEKPGKGQVFEEYPYAEERMRGFYERYMKGEKLKAGWVNESDFEKAPLD